MDTVPLLLKPLESCVGPARGWGRRLSPVPPPPRGPALSAQLQGTYIT